MKTGYCKFSVACKFSHPELATPSGMVFPLQGATAYQPGNAASQVVSPAGFPLVSGFPAWPVSRTPYVMSPPRVQGMSHYAPLMLQTNPNSQHIQPGWATYVVCSSFGFFVRYFGVDLYGVWIEIKGFCCGIVKLNIRESEEKYAM
jgi:Zinc finger C-x8-C-x5-C-x3-H type (and similar)